MKGKLNEPNLFNEKVTSYTKTSSGITLIGLAVSIIVLLILAGMTIRLAAGNDGILGKTTSVVQNYKAAEAGEDVELLMKELETQFYNKTFVNKGNEITEKTPDEYVIAKLNGATTENGYTVRVNGTQITVYEGSEVVATNEFQGSKKASLRWTWVGHKERYADESSEDDENNSYRKYEIGEEIVIDGEYFYVIDDSSDSVSLLAKHCLNRQANGSGKYMQASSNDYYNYYSKFASVPYWESVWNTDDGLFDLNTCEIRYATTITNTIEILPENATAGTEPTYKDETTTQDVTIGTADSAILKAREYGTVMGATYGRLLTYYELQDIITEYENQVEALNDEIYNLESEIDDIKYSLRNVNDQISSLCSDLEYDYDLEYSTANRRLTTPLVESATASPGWRDDIDEKIAQIEELLGEYDEIKDDLRTKEALKKSKEDELTELTNGQKGIGVIHSLIFDSIFYLGTAYDDDSVYYYDGPESYLSYSEFDSSYAGVRPVIEVPKSALENYNY